MTTKLNDEMMKQLNSEIRAFNKTITSSTTNKEIWNKKLELSEKYGLKTIGRCVSENEYEYLTLVTKIIVFNLYKIMEFLILNG